MEFAPNRRYFLKHQLNSCQTGIDIPLGQFQVYCGDHDPIIKVIVLCVGYSFNQ